MFIDKFQRWMTPAQKEGFQELRSAEGKRLLMQSYLKGCFPAFNFMLGYRDTGEFHTKEMEELSKFRELEDKPYRKLWLWFRGAFKTSIISVSHNLWLMVNNPDIRIVIVSYTLGVAQSIVGEMRAHFTNNDNFRYFFKEFAPRRTMTGKVDWGNQEEFTLNCRTKILKEPTCKCAGVGTNLTGGHYDIINCDDIVNKDSVASDALIQSSKDYFSSLGNLFDKAVCPRFKVVGTIYHYNDLYHSSKDGLINNPLFEKSIIPVERDNVWSFPERFSEDKFRAEILNDSSKTPYDIASQYYLRPFNPVDAVFKDEWWKIYEQLPVGLAEYICVDPASTMKKKSDFTVIERWGIDSEGNHYLIEGFRDKIPTEKRVSKLFELVRKCENLKEVSYETVGGRQGDIEAIKDRQIKEQTYFQIREAKCGKSSKRDRVAQRLAGPFSVGAISFPKNCYYKSEYDGKTYDFIQDYRNEFLQFPYCSHDDALDCHSQMFELPSLLLKGERQKSTEKKVKTYADYDREYAYMKKWQSPASWTNRMRKQAKVMKSMRIAVGAE